MIYGMAQFGGKVPPPWQTRPQSTPIQNSLLGQHPASAGPIPNQQIVIGSAPQTPQYAPVQQSMIQPPGLGGLQSIPQPSIPQPHLAQHNLPQPICSSNLAQAGQPSIAQVSLPQPICQGSSSLMGQPPLSTQNLPATNLVSHSQLVPSQMQQIQPQVTTVAYPTPRALAPPGSFSSQGAPVNLAGNLNNSTMQSAAIVAAGGPPSGTGVTNSGTGSQPPQKQRVFTGVITKLCADFGFVDEDVFFQTSCVKGPAPKVSDRVLVEASYNSNMPFKWNANRVQVIPGPINSSDSQNSSAFPCRSSLGQRPRSPRRDRREDNKRGSRDRPDREDKDKELKRESRKRSRSRDRSRSPLRRRARLIPRYNVQVPKIMLHMKEANVLELRKRYFQPICSI
ncbi:Cell division cycle and apoptosis regulator protein 1 [Armadillidium nasatum]|uniref:Cell division cycle and apoptosis regulator protein 1 n=1 Tax=Armadillidium nasatum TaxID=96803 RepID=A0A5N5TPU3_9CRUS|nr:Cell division cycle and apoptosis regulator protein 1 [Armadillidium nasatum]